MSEMGGIVMDCLHTGARPDERFHLQRGTPVCKSWGWRWLYRRTDWHNLVMQDEESIGHFHSCILLWFFRWYSGNVKCDGTRTFMYWWGQLCPDPDPFAYVMTTTPKEMLSVRLGYKVPDNERWDNMGGL